MGYIRPPGVYFDTIGIAFDMIRADFGVYATCSLLLLAITGSIRFGFQIALLGSVTPGMLSGGFDPKFMAVSTVSALITGFVGGFFRLGLVWIGIRHATGHWPSIPDLFHPFARLSRTFPAVIVPVVLTRHPAHRFGPSPFKS